VPPVDVALTSKVPGPETVAVTTVDPVVAAASTSGVTTTVAAPAVELPAANLTDISAEPVATPYAFVIDVVVLSATDPLGITTVHVTAAATAGRVVVSRAAVTFAEVSAVVPDMTPLLYGVKVMTYVPGSVGVKLTAIFALAKAYVVAETAVSIHENCKPSDVTTGTLEFTTTAPAVEPTNRGITVLPVGADDRVILTDIVSLFTPRKPWVMLFVKRAAEPVAQVVVAEVIASVSC